ncbi:MAG: MFS transporter [Steroidobacteraceae bacterium]|nr:MFS transporter [Steroidobacteraceae bacterium]
MPQNGAALSSAERRVLLPLAAIYATRLFGLFLLLPVLALHVGGLPGGTPLLAGLAVGAYGMAQAVMQIPFGAWSDRFGRRPLIVAGLSLHIAGSAIGWLAGSAWAVVAARAVQGLGAVSGPVMALLADLTRPAVRTRAMTVIGISIGASFVLSLVAGPWLAERIGVGGTFALIGLLGAVAMALVLFAVPEPPARRPVAGPRTGPGPWALRLLPHYTGVFMLHLTLTAVFIAVPFALRDWHGIPTGRHWEIYLAVFAASLALTLPLVLWSERSRRPERLLAVAGALLVLALALLAWRSMDLRWLAAALAAYFGAFNFLEARLPAMLAEAAGEASRGAALGVFATCQFAGAFAGGVAGGAMLGSPAGLPGVLFAAGLAALAWLPFAVRAESR